MKTKLRKSILTKLLLIVFVSMFLTIVAINFLTVFIGNYIIPHLMTIMDIISNPKSAVIWGTILIIIYIVIILTLFILIFFLLASRRLKYLKYIIDSVDTIKQKSFVSKLDVKGNDELSELAQNINTMTETIEYRFKKQQEAEQSKYELITAVSHDLKTPLTSIIGYLELLKDGNYKDERDREKYTETAYNKSLRLRKLISELFEYTKLNGSDIIINKERLNISMLLNQMAGESILNFENKHIDINLKNGYESVICSADPHLISRVFENIIGNAEKYAVKNSVFNINLSKDDTNVTITFENQCRSIASSEESKIFDKFYRIDKSRNSSIEGSGLGLSIAKRIVEMHGGSISVKINNNKIKFTVILPLI